MIMLTLIDIHPGMNQSSITVQLSRYVDHLIYPFLPLRSPTDDGCNSTVYCPSQEL